MWSVTWSSISVVDDPDIQSAALNMWNSQAHVATDCCNKLPGGKCITILLD